VAIIGYVGPGGAGEEGKGNSGFLRQHYLDQVQRVGGTPASPSQPLSFRRAEGPVGSPMAGN